MNYKQIMRYTQRLIDKVCPVCHEDFQTTKENQIYCSVACCSSRPRQRKALVCSVCGKEFAPADRYTAGRQAYTDIFCSKACYARAGFGKRGRKQRL